MKPDLIGERYRVERAIGQGGMGTVWLGRDERLHRVVAVKQVGLLPGQSVTDSARAFREARSSAALSHPNVVTVYDVVEESGHLWLVMEHVPGRSLAEVIAQDGPQDPATVADIGAQVAAGLSALHEAGTMHRDVKPGNVLIREDGVAKISDFGIARTSGDPALTAAGMVTGTPSYFSPALARGLEPGPADDVWALGATLYAAVEGHPPYAAQGNPVAVLHEILTGTPPKPVRAQFLEPALQRMMDPDPASRWSMQDAGQVLRRLAESHRSDATVAQTRESTAALAAPPAPEPIADPVPAPAPATAVTERSAPPGDARDRGRPVARIALVAAVVVLLAAGLGWSLSRAGEAEQSTTGSESGVSSSRNVEPTPSPQDSPSSSDGSSSDDESSDSQSPDSQSPNSQSPNSQSPEAMEAFVRDYYAVAPGGTDEAWAMLGPSLKQQGRESYDSFWRTIESAEIRSAKADPDSNTVDITVVYRNVDGKVSTERKREGLIRSEDGGHLLDTDQPAG